MGPTPCTSGDARPECRTVVPPAPACSPLRRGTSRANTIRGTAVSERIRGLASNEVIRGLGGDDCLDGGADNDTITSRDGLRETIRCGPGRDRITADRSDRLIGCERITRR